MAEGANPIDCCIENPEDRSINPPSLKRKRNLPGTPDPGAEVISLSPKALMATNRYWCDICGKGFQRDQNLQLHRRGHNLPWKLKQRMGKEQRKRVYVCPEKSCVHNHPSRALGDLTGIKKHFFRKHGEKKWKCDRCSKRYAVQSDWKAHFRTCGTREYRCNCGTIFSRRDSFITHKAFCDALAEETARMNAANSAIAINTSDGNPTTSDNLNSPFLGPPLIPGMAQVHFYSIFNQFSSDISSANVIDPTNQQISLWMDPSNILHTPAHQLQAPLSSESSSIYDNEHRVHNSNHQLNWVLSDEFVDAHNADRELSNTKNTNPFGAKNGGNGQIVSLHPLFISQFEPHLSNSTVEISTSPSVDDSFLASEYALKGNDGPLEKKFCGIYGIDNSKYHDISLYTSTSRQTIRNNDEDYNLGGETRDFLGVGIQPICYPSSMNGLI